MSGGRSLSIEEAYRLTPASRGEAPDRSLSIEEAYGLTRRAQEPMTERLRIPELEGGQFDPTQPPDAIQDFVNRTAKGVTGAATAAARGVAGLGALPNVAEDTRRKVFESAGVNPDNQFARQPIADPRDNPAWRGADEVDRVIDEALPTDPARDEDLTSGVAQGLGSTLFFLGGGLLGRALGAAGGTSAAVAGGASNAGSGMQEALQRGATLDQALQAGGMSFGVGMSEAIPIARFLERYDRYLPSGWKQKVVEIAAQAGEEALQEAFQTVMGNLITAKLVAYDPQQGIWEGVGEAALIGGLIGGGMQAGSQALRAGRDGEPTPEAPPQEPPPLNAEPTVERSPDELRQARAAQARADLERHLAEQEAGEPAGEPQAAEAPEAGPQPEAARAAPARPRVADPQQSEDIEPARQDTAEPSPAQAKAGNYKKGRVEIGGVKIAIETPQGAERAGVDKDGKPWSTTMPVDYGYIEGSKGADGDQLDVLIGPEPASQMVFVVDQMDLGGARFDEHKVLVGFPDAVEAQAAYIASFSDGRGHDRIGAVTPMTTAALRQWAADTTRKKAPLGDVTEAEYRLRGEELWEEEDAASTTSKPAPAPEPDVAPEARPEFQSAAEILRRVAAAPDQASADAALQTFERWSDEVEARHGPEIASSIRVAAQAQVESETGQRVSLPTRTTVVQRAPETARERAGRPATPGPAFERQQTRQAKSEPEQGIDEGPVPLADSASAPVRFRLFERDDYEPIPDDPQRTRLRGFYFVRLAFPRKANARSFPELQRLATRLGGRVTNGQEIRFLTPEDRQAFVDAAPSVAREAIQESERLAANRSPYGGETTLHRFGRKPQLVPMYRHWLMNQATREELVAQSQHHGAITDAVGRAAAAAALKKRFPGAPPAQQPKPNQKSEPGRLTKAKPDDIPYDRAMQAHSGLSFSPEKRARSDQQEYVEHVEAVAADLMALAKEPRQEQIARNEAEKYRQGYLKRHLEVLGSQSRIISPMIAGPANFPTRQQEKRRSAYEKRVNEFIEWMNKAQARAREAVADALSSEAKREAEVASTLRDIESSARTVLAIDRGEERGLDRSLFVSSIGGKLQRIAKRGDGDMLQRALDRIRELQKGAKKPILGPKHRAWKLGEKAAQAQEAAEAAAAEGPATIAEYEGGVEVISNPQADRVQISFGGIPPQEVRNDLKKAGWRWSRANSVWQRQATNAARASATQVLDRHYERSAEKQAPDAKFAAQDEGPFGPVWRGIKSWPQAVNKLKKEKRGEVPGILYHPEVGPIDVPWGSEIGEKGRDGYGLAHIIDKHPEIVEKLPSLLKGMSRRPGGQTRAILRDGRYRATISLTYHDDTKTWLLTAYDETKKARAARTSAMDGAPEGSSDGHGPRASGSSEDIAPNDEDSKFSRADLPQVEPTERATLAAHIRAEAARIAPGLKVQVTDKIEVPDSAEARASGADKAGAAAYYDDGMAVFALNAIHDPEQARRLVTHEVVHWLKDREVFTKGEWKILTAAAKRKNGWMAQHGIDPKGGDLAVEEGVAYGIQHWSPENRDSDPRVNRIIRKIGDFLERLLNALRGRGWHTLSDVVTGVHVGDIGTRGSAKAAPKGARFARAGTPANPIFGASFQAPPPSLLSHLEGRNLSKLERVKGSGQVVRQKLQDRYIRLKRLQEAITSARGTALPDKLNTYMAETLFHGRVRSRLDQFEHEHLEPLIEAISAAKDVTKEDLELFLYAKHAPERNREIAKINPEMLEGGSGMTDEEASQALSDYEAQGKTAVLEELAARVYAMNEQRLSMWVKDGLLSEAEAAGLRSKYQFYVPLKGVPDPDAKADMPRVGRGFDIRGQETKRALGRRSKATDILSHAISAYEEAVVRGEKNRVGQTFLKLAQAHPNPEVWEVEKRHYTRRVNKKTGQVQEAFNPQQLLADNVLAVKVDGEVHHVTIHDMEIAKALKNIGPSQMSGYVQVLSKFNRVLAGLSTSYNPSFLLPNFARDVATAAINLRAYDERDRTLGAGALAKAMAGVWKGQKGDYSTEWARWYKEFAEEGGVTGFYDMRGIERIEGDLAKRLRALDGGGAAQAQEAFRHFTRAVSDANGAIENTSRLWVYVKMRKGGASKAQAANVAKNITVNFNRRGEWGNALNAHFLFYNAAIQGTTNLLQHLHSRKVRRLMYGVAGMSAGVALLNHLLASMMADDDEPNVWEMIPDWTKEMNLVLINPFYRPMKRGPLKANDYDITDEDGGLVAIKIPLPYGYNVFHYAATKVVELVLSGGEDAMKTAAQILAAGVNGFNPLGAVENPYSMASPTFAKPLVEIGINRDWANRPIRPDRYFTVYEPPRSSQYFRGASTMSRAAAQKLNELTGGDDLRAGRIDLSPEWIDHFFGFLTGGAGTTVGKSVDFMGRLISGEEIPMRTVPVLHRFVEGKNDYYPTIEYYRIRERAEVADDALTKYEKEGQTEKLLRERELYEIDRRILPLVRKTHQKIRKLRKAGAENTDPRIRELQMRVVKQYRRLRRMEKAAP